MLVELSISNLAIIDRLRLQFGPGFNVLTGETGTGKSIIIDAMSLLLGGRASVELVRTGYDEATVEGVFSIDPAGSSAVRQTIEDLGALDDSGELILRREISRSGRNTCRVNGRAMPVSALRDITHHLVDIHGQGDHLSLLQVRQHIDFLDHFEDLVEQRTAFAALAQELRRVRGELGALRRDARETARRIDLLSFQAEEIRAARLRSGEEEELKRERDLLANAEKLLQLSTDAYEALTGGEQGQRSATDLIAQVANELASLAKVDSSLAEQSQFAQNMLYQLEDLARTVRDYRDAVEYNPERLREAEERIDLLYRLKRKYGDSIEDVIAFGQRAEDELHKISHGEERTQELERRAELLLTQMASAGQALHALRCRAAEHLREHIERELTDLNMGQAQFLVDVRWVEAADGVQVERKRYAFDSTGLDQVEFLIAPNPGEAPKPLAKTASGGETSRLMLAMKAALSRVDPVPTLIFDEIDAGIGGRTGTIVGRKLWALAQEHQVFCVTHLAQIACYAERHFQVVKQLSEGRTISMAKALSTSEQVEELAVMLGGGATDATRRSAEELLKHAAALQAKVGDSDRS